MKNLFNRIKRGLKWRIHEFLFTKSFDFFQTFGLHVLPVHYYTPIPDTGRLKKDLCLQELSLKGINLNIERQKMFLKEGCAPFQNEYMSFPKEKTKNPIQYYSNNGSFGFVSGQLQYAMVRFLKPKRIIEVGSGNSTLVTNAALKKNTQEGNSSEFIAVDPYPPQYLENINIQLIRKKVQDTDITMFCDGLFENDMLFIDSSHTVKIGGDVNYLFFDILPSLRKGVVIHIHDISFPFDYFDSHIFKTHMFWQEQYLLQAFLMYNSSFEIIFCASYMHYKHPELMDKYFSPYPKNRVPTSLYIRKIDE